MGENLISLSTRRQNSYIFLPINKGIVRLEKIVAISFIGIFTLLLLATVNSALASIEYIYITSPTARQQVGSGASASILGTSSDDGVKNCRISVHLNNILLLNQRVTASGPGGVGDYSQWSIDVGSSMAPLREGENTVTAKMSCPGNVSADPHDTVYLVVGGTSPAGEDRVDEPGDTAASPLRQDLDDESDVATSTDSDVATSTDSDVATSTDSDDGGGGEDGDGDGGNGSDGGDGGNGSDGGDGGNGSDGGDGGDGGEE